MNPATQEAHGGVRLLEAVLKCKLYILCTYQVFEIVYKESRYSLGLFPLHILYVACLAYILVRLPIISREQLSPQGKFTSVKSTSAVIRLTDI